ncbi:hypothetical protein [Nocardia sp. AG03]|uniref:hypothetical protein n=1 Tax=Nocardia sp. AG03 TaxID=3025312 RepID=UPI0024189770|nr:hypothetical protein [Nocardia sp. AG03]
MSDITGQRRTHWAEKHLAAHPHLTAAQRVRPRVHRRGAAPDTTPTDSLFDRTDLDEETRASFLARPFRDWTTFLDPEQLALVHTNFTGPARFSGPAGTGKSVVALHRMAHFAKRNPGRLLFTSFVRTLPTYHRSGFARIAPAAADRAEFVGLHAWTTRFLERRRVTFDLDVDGSDDAMARTWMGVRDRLDGYEGTDYQYWEDEIRRVIKGRGLGTLDEYRAIVRSGRNGLQLNGSCSSSATASSRCTPAAGACPTPEFRCRVAVVVSCARTTATAPPSWNSPRTSRRATPSTTSTAAAASSCATAPARCPTARPWNCT